MTGLVAFTAANRVPPPFPPTIELLIVAGGGGGGSQSIGYGGGGGGAGGYRTFANAAISGIGVTYALVLGGGGAVNTNGSNSSFIGGSLSYTSAGGGRGGTGNSGVGGTGGSGGGSGAGDNFAPGAAGNTPATTPSQGNSGGTTIGNVQVAGGGGGIGGGGGGSGSTAGGAGTASSITGASVTRAGGGGGQNGTAGSAAAANLGTGGQGAPGGGSAGAGWSGVIIIAYPDIYIPITNIGGGLTYSYSTVSRAGYRVYQFTAGSGNISW